MSTFFRKMDIQLILAVGAGGALGSALRYSLSLYFIQDVVISPWPWGTWIANVLGSLLLGLWAGWLTRNSYPAWLQAGVGTGFCGGFTTMSTFVLEWRVLFETPQLLALYVVSSLGLGLLAVALGWYLGVGAKARASVGVKGGDRT
jgi:CrcB protein